MEKVNQAVAVNVFLHTEKIGEASMAKPDLNRIIRAAKDYIFKNLHGKESIRQLAEWIGTSPSCRSSLLRKQENKPIQQYIGEVWLDRTQNMLHYSA